MSIRAWIEGSFEFAVSDLWPDGDAPDPVTAEDVVALMHEDAASVRALIAQWFMDALDLTVEVEGDSIAAYRNGVALRLPPTSAPDHEAETPGASAEDHVVNLMAALEESIARAKAARAAVAAEREATR